jgi:hypothetical protein
MDPLAIKVARRFQAASLEHDFVSKVDKLLSYDPEKPPKHELQEFAKWIVHNFHFQTRYTPKGMKREKEELDRFYRSIERDVEYYEHYLPGALTNSIRSLWEDQRMKALVPAWVSAFSSVEGGAKALTREKKVGGNTYVNMVGVNDEKLDAMIAEMEGIFAGLKGWHRGALSGGIKVHLAGPKDFRGTASGKYGREGDILWIRATVGGRIERAGSGYGGFSYVVTHELGHRYEAKHHLKVDFDRAEWHTTKYSINDGESFAELFALSNFGMTSMAKPGVLENFEAVMSGAPPELKPEIPEHLKKFRGVSVL